MAILVPTLALTADFEPCIIGPCEDTRRHTSGETAGVVMVTAAIAAPFILSGVIGASRVRACNRAHEERERSGAPLGPAEPLVLPDEQGD